MSTMSVEKKPVEKKPVEKKPVEEEEKSGPFHPRTWPGRGMTAYQFPPVTHNVQSRAAATSWLDMIQFTRKHGTPFKKSTGGNYPWYKCTQCDGHMNITFGAGARAPGTVSESAPCTCAQLSGSPNIITNKVACEKLDMLIGHAILYIATTLGDFVQGFWRYSVSDTASDTTNTTKRKRRRNNGDTAKITFATAARKLWVLSTKKVRVKDKESTFKVVSLVSVDNLNKQEAASSNLGVERGVDSKPAAQSNHFEVANKNNNTVQEGEATDDLPVGAPGQCLVCCSKRPLVEIMCRICAGSELCYNCFNEWCATRCQKPLDKFFHTDFVLIYNQDGLFCPRDRNLCTEVRHPGSLVPTGMHVPYGWIGERPERNLKSFEITMDTYNMIVLPYIEAYAEANMYVMQGNEVHDAYLLTRDEMERLLGNSNFVEQQDQKYAHWFKVLEKAKQHYRTEVSKYKWLELGVSGHPLEIPPTDVALAKELAKKGVPIDAAGSYPAKDKAELGEVKAAIDKATAIYKENE